MEQILSLNIFKSLMDRKVRKTINYKLFPENYA